MRQVLAILCLGVIVSFSGCALCCSPFDHEYATYGSRTPRADQQYGRVGSVFSDPNLLGADTEFEEEFTDQEFYAPLDGSAEAEMTTDPMIEEEPLRF